MQLPATNPGPTMAQRRLLLLLGCVLYIVGLHLAYLLVLAPDYGTRGFSFTPPDLASLLLAWLSAIAPGLWLPVALRRPSQVVYWLLYILVIAPSCIVPLYSLGLDPAQLLLQNGALLAAFGLLGAIYFLPLLRLPQLRIRSWVFWSACVCLTAGLFAWVILEFGLRINVVGLLDAYSMRADYRAGLPEGSLLGYAVDWLGYVLLPLLIMQTFLNRVWWGLALAVFGEFELYEITGFKTLLFLAPLLLGVMIAIGRRGSNFGPFIIWGTTALALVALLATLVSGEPLLLYLAVGRPIATPGLLTGFYFQFFSNNDPALLRHSVLSFLGPYPYEATPPFLIGAEYFSKPTMSANGNYLADAFANFGYPGLFGFTLLLGAILWLADSITARLKDSRATLLIAISGYTLANSGLLTSLLTHGIGLALLALYFMPPLRQRPPVSEPEPLLSPALNSARP